MGWKLFQLLTRYRPLLRNRYVPLPETDLAAFFAP